MMYYNRKRGKSFWIKAALLGPLAIAAGVYVFGSVVMLLWNGILPDLFGFGVISFWQAIGILVLSKILFGGFGSGHRGRSCSNRHRKDRWMNLSPEEKEKMKTDWRSRCQTSEKAE
jgi:hypothetical protein